MKKTLLSKTNPLGYLAFMVITLFAILCVIPFFLSLMGSFTAERELIHEGLKLFPERLSLDAYRHLFHNGERVVTGYKVTLFVTITGTLICVLVNGMFGYVLSRKKLRYRHFLSMYVFITMVFHGGMVAWYITMVKTLHLRNSIWGLIIPYVVNPWYLFILRNFFSSIPDSLPESAIIDGAGEFRIFTRIIVPLSTPAIATVVLFAALQYWNDWRLGIFLMDRKELQPLQLMLRNIVSNIQFMNNTNTSKIGAGTGVDLLPAEGVKMATMVITMGPILLLYPFLQKYFIKGIMIGAIKG